MTARIIDGKAIAAELRARVAGEVARVKRESGVVPGLAVVLVGNDPASEVYVRSKHTQTQAAGMASFEHKLPADVGQDDLLALVAKLNRDPSVHGILVQLPLPKSLHTETIINALLPALDPLPLDHAWLLLATLQGDLPHSEQVRAAARAAQEEGPLAALRLGIWSGPLPRVLDAGPFRRVEVAVGEVLVDVHHTAGADFATGIQRVTREVARRWLDRHQVTLIGWTPTMQRGWTGRAAATSRPMCSPTRSDWMWQRSTRTYVPGDSEACWLLIWETWSCRQMSCLGTLVRQSPRRCPPNSPTSSIGVAGGADRACWPSSPPHGSTRQRWWTPRPSRRWWSRSPGSCATSASAGIR